MRAVLFVLILIVLAAVAAIGTGYLDISQTRAAKAPQVSTTDNGVAAKGGQSPAFDVKTGSVKVGTTETTVKVPTLEVEPADANTAAASNAN